MPRFVTSYLEDLPLHYLAQIRVDTDGTTLCMYHDTPGGLDEISSILGSEYIRTFDHYGATVCDYRTYPVSATGGLTASWGAAIAELNRVKAELTARETATVYEARVRAYAKLQTLASD